MRPGQKAGGDALRGTVRALRGGDDGTTIAARETKPHSIQTLSSDTGLIPPIRATKTHFRPHVGSCNGWLSSDRLQLSGGLELGSQGGRPTTCWDPSSRRSNDSFRTSPARCLKLACSSLHPSSIFLPPPPPPPPILPSKTKSFLKKAPGVSYR